MPRLLPEDHADSDACDLFVEERESYSIHWTMDSSAVRHGWRDGAGLRRRIRGGGVVFAALDDPTPERIDGAFRALVAGESVQDGPLRRGLLSEGRDPGEEPLGRIGEVGSPGGEPVARTIAYVESAARGILTEIAARSIEAEAHIFRQKIHHEGPHGSTEDVRGGVRVEIRAALEGLAPVRRRLADQDMLHLAARRPPLQVGGEIGRTLLGRREGMARVDGEFPVVFAPGSCGVLIHEVGHLLEADHARGSNSRFARGQRVGPAMITIQDDPAACRGRGAYNLDDEGAPARAKTLVRAGVALDTLVTGLGEEPWANGGGGSGHGRRASYRDLPLPRMACTFLEAGCEPPESILTQTPRGIYVHALRAGEVDPGSGTLTLIIDEGSLIEAGRLTKPFADAVIVARAPGILDEIDAVGSDLEFDFGAGDCIKSDQAVTVIVGMPTLRIRVVRVMAL